jgi:hypothetical protein
VTSDHAVLRGGEAKLVSFWKLTFVLLPTAKKLLALSLHATCFGGTDRRQSFNYDASELKIKCMHIYIYIKTSRQTFPVKLTIDQTQLENMEFLNN